MFKSEVDEELDITTLQELLQRDVVFYIKQKVLRKGKLLLYNECDYYIKFNIITNKNIHKTFEVPYPFKIYKKHNSVFLSYMLSDLFCDESVAIDNIETNNKFYNTKLTITNMD